MSGQYDIKEFLENNKDNKYTTNELSIIFNVTRSSITSTINKCIKSGWIEKEHANTRKNYPYEYLFFAKVI